MEHTQNIPESVIRFLRFLTVSTAIDRIVLFGSRAFGDNDPRADVDIAVSAPTLNRLRFARFRVAAYEARTLYWVSLVHLEETPEVLRKRIEEQGVILYDRQKTKR